MEGRAVAAEEDVAIWTRGMEQEDSLAAAAVDRFCLSLGSIAGDFALAQGASGVVIAGGFGLRLRGHQHRSGFDRSRVVEGRRLAVGVNPGWHMTLKRKKHTY